MLLTRLWLLAVVFLAACQEPELPLNGRWFADPAFDDGAAVISVYRGRVLKYGIWRDAEVRDYVIREYLDPTELTKREKATATTIPVLKVNRHITFATGTYDYRLMHSLFFDRRSGALVKAVATSQEGCGVAFQRWDRASATLTYDTYWEGEGAGTKSFGKNGSNVFADEVPFLAAQMSNATTLQVWPSLMRNKIGTFEATAQKVEKSKSAVMVGDAEYRYDEQGFLTRWKSPTEEFSRVKKTRLYYWKHTKPGDEKLLK